MRALVVSLVGACSSHTPVPVTNAPDPLSPTVDAAVAVAATPVDAAPDASPALAIPDALRDAKPQLVARTYVTGMVGSNRYQHGHFTYELRRDGSSALITVLFRKHLRGSTNWNLESSTYHLGTITDTASGFHFRGNDLDLTCKRERIEAAPATARRESGGSNGSCGAPGWWKPKSTQRLAVLDCTPDPDNWHQIAFTPPPGDVEWLHIDDDCAMQGGGWRMAPADGSIVPARWDMSGLAEGY